MAMETNRWAWSQYYETWNEDQHQRMAEKLAVVRLEIDALERDVRDFLAASDPLRRAGESVRKAQDELDRLCRRAGFGSVYLPEEEP